jgi:hypothetical protein
MYLRKTMTYHRSQDDASYHVQQHARMITLLLHTHFVFRANHAPKDAASNANEMI